MEVFSLENKLILYIFVIENKLNKMKNIIAFGGSNSKKSINKQLAVYASELLYGVDVTILDLNEMAKKAGYVSEGDTIINLASMPIKERGMVNTLRVSSI